MNYVYIMGFPGYIQDYGMNREEFCGINFSIRYRSCKTLDSIITHLYNMNLFDNKIYSKWIESLCCRRRPQQVSLCVLHCDVECFDGNGRKP